MKIQCSCGAKYAFDVTPEQAQRPVRFVCPACGLDSSEFVTQLVRAQFAPSVPPPAAAAPAPAGVPAIEVSPPPGRTMAPAPAAGPPAPASPLAPPVSPPSAPVRLHLRRPTETATETPATTPAEPLCPKHPGQPAVEKCFVCGKPICAKCMELFGYLCSPLCRQKAELKGIEVPVFAGQKALVERRHWRRVGLVAGGVGALLAALLGVWIWYAWFGSHPRKVYSVRFADPAYAGCSVLCGTNQLVFLHGGTLARHDLKAKKAIWSVPLIDKAQIARQVEQEIKRMIAHKAEAESVNPDLDIKIPPADKLQKWTERSLMASLELRVVGQNVWVRSPDKLTRYDWNTGQPAQEIALANRFGGLIARGDEWLLMQQRPGKELITHLSLATGETRDEEVPLPERLPTKTSGKTTVAGTRATTSTNLAGLPAGAAGKDGGRPLDPAKVSEQASHLTLPGRLALPAVLSIQRNQERALAEMNDSQRQAARKPGEPPPPEYFTLIPAKSGAVQFGVQLIEERLVQREAMKPPPKKSALEGAPSVARTTDIANEILNEMQRDRGGATVTEDESLYRVTIRCPGAKDVPDWTAEVAGPPALHPLPTVNVLTAGKTITVLDKRNKKLWQATLSYPVRGGGGALDEEDEDPRAGLGPCVERGDRLYVCDQGTLTAFDLKTGTAQWRLPSVGISELFFDDAGMLYLNTTTASHESLKYSRQIDIAQRTSGSVMKVDPKTGKTLWSTQTAGQISHLSGKYIYSVQYYRPLDDEEEAEMDDIYRLPGLSTQPYLRIRRINPKNGHEMWEYFEPRGPLDVQFDRNSIRIVFKKEVEVLKFLSF
jgi:hypothetical protein